LQKRHAVDGELEIAPRSTDEARLCQWIDESRFVLPRLRALVNNGHPGLSRFTWW